MNSPQSTGQGPKQRRARRRRFARRQRWLLVLLGVFVLVPALGSVGLNTRWARDKIRHAIVRAARVELGQDASIGDVSISIVPPRAEATDVVLSHPVHGEFLRTRRLRVVPAFWPLLNGILRIDEVVAEGAAVRVLIVDGAPVNLPTPRVRPHPIARARGPAPAMFSSILIRRGRLVCDVRGWGTVRLDDVLARVNGRSGDRYAVSLHASGGRIDGRQIAEPIHHVILDVETDPRAIAVRSFEVAAGRVRVGASQMRVPLPFEGDLAGRVEFHGPMDTLNRLPIPLPRFQGQADAQGQLRLTDLRPDFQGQGRIAGFRIDQFGLGDAEGPVHITTEGLSWDNARLRTASGWAEGTGGISFGRGSHMRLRGRVHGVEFAEALEQLGLTDAHVVWKADGDFQLDGPLAPVLLAGSFDFHAREFRVLLDRFRNPEAPTFFAIAEGRARGQVTFADRFVRLQGVTLATGNSVATGDAVLGYGDRFEIHARSPDLRLADFGPIAGIPYGGHGPVSLDIDSPYTDAVVRARARIAGFEFQGFPLGDVETEVASRGLSVRLRNLQGHAGASHYRFGELLLDFSGRQMYAAGRVDTPDLRFDDFLRMWHLDGPEMGLQSLRGIGIGSADITYERDILTVAFRGRVPETSFGGETFADGEVEGVWRWVHRDQGWRGAETHFDHLTLRKGDGTISLVGQVGLGGALDLLLVVDQLDSSSIDHPLARVLPIHTDASVLLQVRGTADRPRASGQLTLSDTAWQTRPLGASLVLIELDGPQLTLSGSRLFGDAVTLADASIDLAGDFPLRGRAEIRALPLTPFLTSQRGAPFATGELSGNVDLVRAPLRDLAKTRGQVLLTQLALRREAFEIRNQNPVRVELRGDAFLVERSVLAGPGTRIELSGGGTDAGGLSLALTGAIDMAFLEGLLPQAQTLRGRLSFGCTVNGTVERPVLLGHAEIADGMLGLRDVAERFENVRGTLRFSPRSVVLENLRGRYAGGEVRARADLRLRGTDVIGVVASARVEDAAVTLQADFPTVLDGEVQLAWREGERLPTLSGDLNVARLRYNRPITLGGNLNDLNRSARRAALERYDPNADFLALDLRVHAGGNLTISNNLIDTELRIDESERPFRVIGTNQRVGVLGTLATTRGMVYWQNTPFEIRRGVIRFDDRYRIQPRFDLLAETEIRGGLWRVTLHAVGTADDFQVFTLSDPPLSQSDIVLLLTVGMTREEAENLTVGDLTQSAALNALATATGVAREVRRVVPIIDEFRIGSAFSTRTNRPEPEVSVGKRLTSRLRIDATTGLGEDRSIRANVEMRLGQNFSLNGVYLDSSTASTQFGDVGVDLRWRLEFE